MTCYLVNTRRHKSKDSNVHVARGVACGSGAAARGGKTNLRMEKKIDFLNSSNFRLFGQGKGISINMILSSQFLFAPK